MSIIENNEDLGVLRFITAGSVDDGKRALIGRLLYDGEAMEAEARRAPPRETRMRAGGGVVRYDDFVRLDKSVRRARQYGLTDPADLELFALHALESGPDFDLHPLAQALLRDRPEDVYYSRAIAELDGTQWDEIRKAHRGIHQLIEE